MRDKCQITIAPAFQMVIIKILRDAVAMNSDFGNRSMTHGEQNIINKNKLCPRHSSYAVRIVRSNADFLFAGKKCKLKYSPTVPNQRELSFCLISLPPPSYLQNKILMERLSHKREYFYANIKMERVSRIGTQIQFQKRKIKREKGLMIFTGVLSTSNTSVPSSQLCQKYFNIYTLSLAVLFIVQRLRLGILKHKAFAIKKKCLLKYSHHLSLLRLFNYSYCLIPKTTGSQS